MSDMPIDQAESLIFDTFEAELISANFQTEIISYHSPSDGGEKQFYGCSRLRLLQCERYLSQGHKKIKYRKKFIAPNQTKYLTVGPKQREQWRNTLVADYESIEGVDGDWEACGRFARDFLKAEEDGERQAQSGVGV